MDTPSPTKEAPPTGWAPWPVFPGFTLRGDDYRYSHAPPSALAALSSRGHTDLFTFTFTKSNPHVPPTLIQANNIAAIFKAVDYFHDYRDEPFFYQLVSGSLTNCTAADAKRIIDTYEAARSESVRSHETQVDSRLALLVDISRAIPPQKPRFPTGELPAEVRQRHHKWADLVNAGYVQDLVTADFLEEAEADPVTMADIAKVTEAPSVSTEESQPGSEEQTAVAQAERQTAKLPLRRPCPDPEDADLPATKKARMDRDDDPDEQAVSDRPPGAIESIKGQAGVASLDGSTVRNSIDDKPLDEPTATKQVEQAMSEASLLPPDKQLTHFERLEAQVAALIRENQELKTKVADLEAGHIVTRMIAGVARAREQEARSGMRSELNALQECFEQSIREVSDEITMTNNYCKATINPFITNTNKAIDAVQKSAKQREKREEQMLQEAGERVQGMIDLHNEYQGLLAQMRESRDEVMLQAGSMGGNGEDDMTQTLEKPSTTSSTGTAKKKIVLRQSRGKQKARIPVQTVVDLGDGESIVSSSFGVACSSDEDEPRKRKRKQKGRPAQ